MNFERSLRLSFFVKVNVERRSKKKKKNWR
jgi:hypothetical protein